MFFLIPLLSLLTKPVPLYNKARIYFVAPGGNDASLGSLKAPFATLEHAKVAAEKLVQQGQDTIISLWGGTYFLPRTLTFGSLKSTGKRQANLEFRAYSKNENSKPEKVTISGGKKLTGWTVDAQNRWHLTLPEVKAGTWNFSQLWVNGERRFRPHLPKTGYYQIEETLPPSGKSKGPDGFGFRAGDLKPEWYDLASVEGLPFHIWTMSRFHIAEIDAQKNRVRFEGGTPADESYFQMPRGNRFLVENVKEALGEPGEWYLDRKTGELTYVPKRGETPGKTEVIAPVLETLITLKGKQSNPVQNVDFKNLTFAHTNYVLPEKGRSFPQAEIDLRGAVNLDEARDINFTQCRFTHLGGYGVDFGTAVKDSYLETCELTDLGAGGVKIGTTTYEKDPARVTSFVNVLNCKIAHGGRLHPAGIGVWIGQATGCNVLNNDIYDFYYTGISAGWNWGYAPSNGQRHSILRNHIYNIGQGVLSDMGGIYTLGDMTGTKLENNFIHDIKSLTYGGWGIYFDEGTTGILAQNNVVTRTKSAGFHQHYGKNNRIINNIFAFGEEAQLMRTRAEDHLSFTAERNIMLSEDHPILGSNWSGNNFTLTKNLYWNMGKSPVNFAGKTFAKWQAEGHDKGSLYGDPLFVDAKGDNFTPRLQSPARKLGFVHIDLTQTGRRDGTRKGYSPVDNAIAPTIFRVPRLTPLPPAALKEDFEETPVGSKPGKAHLFEEGNEAVIRVTNEVAHTGKHSLKFTDRAGLSVSYAPHLYYEPGFTEGVLIESFAFRREAGALFYHAWRTNDTPYIEGPSIRVTQDGTLTANGKKLTQLPVSRWITIEIRCGVGKDATGTYSLRVKGEGRTPAEEFRDLPCPKLSRLSWLGFVADANADAVFYLDDISLK